MDKVDYAFAEASNRFGINLYYLLAKENTNVFFSPFSISSALATLFCGARNETAEEMRNTLGYEDANIKNEEFKFCFLKLLEALDSSEDCCDLNYATALLSDKKFPIKEEYKSLLEHFFKVFIKEVDFVNERDDAVNLVNKWVKTKTNGMISELVHSLDPSTVLIILNAVHFKGYWFHQFKEHYTKPQDFYNKGNKNDCKQVNMMHITEHFLYAERETYKAIQLPYMGGDMSMLILLPNSEDGLSELEKSLSFTFIRDIKQSMSGRKVEVALPKFELEYSTSLKQKFQSLGLKRVFDRGAHLSGINDSDEFFLSEVNHTAIVVVNEEGTEAAAVSGKFLRKGETPVEERPTFIVDHPFMFVIYSAMSKLILFMGRVDELSNHNSP